ncbi:MAG: putative ABC transporter permease [Nanoarchaeota archaeon]|nr:putative ABC transporter permease [Nanoarchaeota archaeon]
MIMKLLFLFSIASITGYILELIWRNIFAKEPFKNFLNPGFLRGPYLIIHGLSVIAIYFLWLVNISFIIKVIIAGILLTLMELFTGIIIKKIYNLKLWDYSNKMLNYKGYICLNYSIYWLVLSGLLFLAVPHFNNLMINISNYFLLKIFLILFYLIFLLDLFSTLFNKKRIQFLCKKFKY